MMEKIFDIAFEFNGDYIELEQDAGCGEVNNISLHITHLRLLAERAGLLTSIPEPTLPAGLVRKLIRLKNDASYYAADCWMDEIGERISDGLAYRLGMTAVMDLLDDILFDIDITPGGAEGAAGLPAPNADILQTDCGHGAADPRNEKSAAISVTVDEPKRGRPATGEALTNAERQARHRAKQNEQDSPQRELVGMPG